MARIERVKELPESVRPRRDSLPRQIVEQAKLAPGEYIKVTEDTTDAAVRLYKSMIQYIRRHTGEGINLRKQGNTFYVWIDDASGTESSAQRTNSKRVLPPKSSGAQKRVQGQIAAQAVPNRPPLEHARERV